jgi:hypothetical protein
LSYKSRRGGIASATLKALISFRLISHRLEIPATSVLGMGCALTAGFPLPQPLVSALLQNVIMRIAVPAAMTDPGRNIAFVFIAIQPDGDYCAPETKSILAGLTNGTTVIKRKQL